MHTYMTPLLLELYWLRVPERVTFWLCVLAYRCLRGTATTYLAGSLLRTSDVDTRCCLHSADTAILVVPSTRRSTLGDRAFPVTLARAWNGLPSSVRNAPSQAEDCTFLVVVWQWFGDCFVLFCMVPLQCLWHDRVVILISTLLLTYLLAVTVLLCRTSLTLNWSSGRGNRILSRRSCLMTRIWHGSTRWRKT